MRLVVVLAALLALALACSHPRGPDSDPRIAAYRAHYLELRASVDHWREAALAAKTEHDTQVALAMFSSARQDLAAFEARMFAAGQAWEAEQDANRRATNSVILQDALGSSHCTTRIGPGGFSELVFP